MIKLREERYVEQEVKKKKKVFEFIYGKHRKPRLCFHRKTFSKATENYSLNFLIEWFEN